MDELRVRLLAVAFRHAISEPNVEAGFERVRELTGGTLTYDGFRDALDGCLRDGLIREPVCLPEGALQCHWRLELTPAGVAAVREMDPHYCGDTSEPRIEQLSARKMAVARRNSTSS